MAKSRLSFEQSFSRLFLTSIHSLLLYSYCSTLADVARGVDWLGMSVIALYIMDVENVSLPRGLWDLETSEGDEATSQTASAGPPSGQKPSALHLVHALIFATESERWCPEILPYPHTLVQRAIEALMQHSATIAQMKQAAAAHDSDDDPGSRTALPFKAWDILSYDAQRTEALLGDLLRMRMRKIEAMSAAIAYQNKNGLGKYTHVLSPNELAVALRLHDMRERYLENCGLSGVPSALRSLLPNPPVAEGPEILPHENVDAHVIVYILTDLGAVDLGGERNEMNKGEMYLVPYRSIRPYVVDGRARLLGPTSQFEKMSENCVKP